MYAVVRTVVVILWEVLLRTRRIPICLHEIYFSSDTNVLSLLPIKFYYVCCFLQYTLLVCCTSVGFSLWYRSEQDIWYFLDYY